MGRIWMEVCGGKITNAYSNIGQVEILVVDKDNHIGYRLIANHSPDLTEKDERRDGRTPHLA